METRKTQQIEDRAEVVTGLKCKEQTKEWAWGKTQNIDLPNPSGLPVRNTLGDIVNVRTSCAGEPVAGTQTFLNLYTITK